MRVHKIKFGLWIILFIFVYFCMVYHADRMRIYSDKLSLYNTHMNLNAAQALRIQEQNNMSDLNLSFSLWCEEPGATIKNNSLLKEAEISVIEVTGRADLLFEAGSALDEFDYQGCIIDIDTAHKLFGSKNVIGKSVTYGEQEYIVREVISEPRNTVIVQMNESSKNFLTTVTVQKEKNMDITEMKTLLETKYQIAGEVLDYDLVNDLVRIFMAMIPLVLVGILFICFLQSSRLLFNDKSVLQHKPQMAGFFVMAVLCLVSIVLIVTLYDNIFVIYGKCVPAKWSDFSFWSKLWTEKRQNIVTLVKIPKSGFDLYYFYDFYKVIILYIAVLYILLKIYRGLKIFQKPVDILPR